MNVETGAYVYYNEVTEEFSAEVEGVAGAAKPYILGADQDLEPNLWQVCRGSRVGWWVGGWVGACLRACVRGGVVWR